LPNIFAFFNINNFSKPEFQCFVSGLFINCGYISSPISNFYHLEFKLFDLELLKIIVLKLKKYQINFKILNSKPFKRCYLKKFFEISDFLKFLNAFKSVYFFENKKIERNFINDIKKSINLNLANQQKIIKASNQNILLIKKLKQNNSFILLPPKLKILCQLRIDNPDFNYNELAKLMNQKLNLKLKKNDIFLMFKKLKLIEKLK